MRVLITGSRGFVGRHFWRVLDTPDNELMGVDVKDFDIPGAVGDCRRLFAESDEHFDLVLHCAAIVGGRATIDGEPMKVATDLAIDSDMFQWALRTRPGRVVYFSSSAAYPTWMQTGPWPGGSGQIYRIPMQLRETDINLERIEQPDAVYGWVKLTGEMLAGHARAEGLNVTVVRPFSGYGPDQDIDYPFPSFVRRALDRADPFTVWGDGAQVRDWIHIDDVVGATMALVGAGVDGPVNLCTGRGTSMDDLAKMAMAVAAHDAPIAHHLDAPTGVAHRVGDPTLMHQWYRPRWTLEAGVADAVARLGSVA